MESFQEKYGSWAMIAGAAEGLGEAYSLALAKKGMNLLMVDHQKERLNGLSTDLERGFGIRAVPVHLDLASADAVERMMEMVTRHGCRLLIYNAAFSQVRPFLSAGRDDLDRYIDVNCRVPLRLVHSFGNRLVRERARGGILLMSSLAGLIGMQLVTPYAATKAFNWNLAEALHHEWAGNGIDIMACVAGATATPAYLSTKPVYGWPKPAVMDPADVAEGALKNLGKKFRYIPGFSNRMNYFLLTRIMPRKMAAGIANRTMKTMYSKQMTDAYQG